MNELHDLAILSVPMVYTGETQILIEWEGLVISENQNQLSVNPILTRSEK